jgi:hypothetical protein
MKSYKKLLNHLGASKTMCLCHDGIIKLPIAYFESPFDWFGFPPALIPIWSDGSSPSYLGIWKHWFTDRHLTYVEMYVEQSHRVFEVARTEDQFFCRSLIYAIIAADGVTSAVKNFANEIGINNLSEIDELTLNTGDDPKKFIRLPQFVSKTPLETIGDAKAYDGDFPTGDFSKSQSWLRKTCTFEFNEQILSDWPCGLEKPRWLRGQEQLPLFNELLSLGDLENAWLTLNSTGWTFADAVVAIQQLAQTARDESFNLLASAWIENARNDPGGY